MGCKSDLFVCLSVCNKEREVERERACERERDRDRARACVRAREREYTLSKVILIHCDCKCDKYFKMYH